MKTILLVIGILFFISSAHSQIIIQGTVQDTQQKKGVEGLNITIQEKDNPAILGFTMTDKDGKYRIEYKGEKDSLIIITSGFNIQRQSKTVARRSQTLDFTVNFESIALREVKVTPPRIRQRGDTVSYLVDSFLDKNDHSIGDVLKKLPGIDVQESGQILYQNTPINKFYIEGLDLLQGRYGIATKNIAAKDVQSVEVLENHQAIKALKDKIISEQAAINLKLKESAKGVLTSYALPGAGFSPALWSGELSTTYFGKGKQNISTYKGNNTGNDVSAEQALFYSFDSFQQQETGLLNVQSPSSPAISRKRYLFNKANAIAFNNLWKVSTDYQVNANINYVNDRIDKSSFAKTEYYLLNDGLLNIEETLNSRLYVNRANAEILINGNKDKFFLNNKLKFEGGWDSEQGNAISRDTVRQRLEKPNYGVNNTFELIKNYEKTALRISSYNSYTTLPHTLTIQPVLYGNLFEPDGNFRAMRQNVNSNRFSSSTSVSGGIDHRNLHQSYALNFRADLRHLDSELTPEQQGAVISSEKNTIPDSLRNDLQWNKLEWIFTPQYLYNYDDWRVNIGLPFNYTHITVNDHVTDREKINRRLLFNPSLRIQYKLSAYWDFYSYAGLSNGLGGINNEYTGYIMQSYRSLMRNDGELYETKIQNYSLNVNYKNPIRALFANVGISYFNTKANLLYGYDYSGILQVRKTLLYPNHTEGITTNAGINQTIDAIASTVKIGGRYTQSISSQLTQGNIIQTNRRQYSVFPEITTRLGARANFTYRYNYNESRNKIKNDKGNIEPIHTTTQSVHLNVFPMKDLIVNFIYEYFHNSAVSSGSRRMSFGDIGVKYRRNRMEFLLDYTNVFNSKQYISASHSEISSYYYIYDLRPAEILLRVRFKLK